MDTEQAKKYGLIDSIITQKTTKEKVLAKWPNRLLVPFAINISRMSNA
jgi:hypothetical protein